jgi:3-deoxy-D-manno-octulosonate 8-phosphate phosphatase KdsC-like HAD superfamily phosphatase
MTDIKLLVLDFDGVLTDNRVLVDENGKEAAFCHRGDGYGIGLLKKMGLPVLVLSTEPNPIVVHRCKKLAVSFIHRCTDKLCAMKSYARGYEVETEYQEAILLGVSYAGKGFNGSARESVRELATTILDQYQLLLAIER